MVRYVPKNALFLGIVRQGHNKLAGIELCVSESLVRETRQDLNEISQP